MADTEKQLASPEDADRGSSPLSAEDDRSPTSAAPVELDATTTGANHVPSPESQGLLSPQSPTSTVLRPQSPQYVEFDESAGPQVVFASGGDVVGGGVGNDVGDDAEAEAGTAAAAAVSAGTVEAAEKSTAAGPPGRLTRLWRMARKSPYIVAAIISFTVGMLALIILPVVLHTLSVREAKENSSPANASTTCSTCSASSTSASSSPSQSATPDACIDQSAWATDVSYMGVADEGATDWPYKLLAASSATACCTTCYNDFSAGCQGWAYLPWQDTPVPCTIIYGWNATTGVSTTCPNGKATINFGEDTSRANSTGSQGPCGTVS